MTPRGCDFGRSSLGVFLLRKTLDARRQPEDLVVGPWLNGLMF